MGDLVLPPCPAWVAIWAHTGNKSACLPRGGCTAPAASAHISQSQITQGCRLGLCRSSELPQLCFCCHILPKALRCPRVQEQHLPVPSPAGSPARERSHQPWLLSAAGSWTSLTQLEWNLLLRQTSTGSEVPGQISTCFSQQERSPECGFCWKSPGVFLLGNSF